MILLVVSSFSLSVRHWTDVIIPGNPIFFLNYFSPKILWEMMLLRFLIWKYQLLIQTLGTFLIQR